MKRETKKEREERESKYYLACSTYLNAVMPDSGYSYENDNIETNKYLDAYLAINRINYHIYNDGYCTQDAEEWEIPSLKKFVEPVLGRTVLHKMLYTRESYLINTMNELASLAVKNFKPPIKLIALRYEGKTLAVRIKLTRRSFDVALYKAKQLNLPMHLMKTKLELYLKDGELITEYEDARLWFESYKLALDITDDEEVCNIISNVTWDLSDYEY